MLEMTWDEVRARRLARHRLLRPAAEAGLAEIASAVCGIQAQVLPAAEIALCIRLPDATRQDVRTALAEKRELVRTYGLRGTIHIFSASELPLWMAALQARSEADPKRLERLRLSEDELASILDAIRRALDGACRTMSQLGAEIGRHAGAWAQELDGLAWGGNMPRWRMALGEAARAGLLVYGPPQGNEVTFVRPDQWLGAWTETEPDAALAEVLRRYLRSYGPATTRDFAQWFDVPPKMAREIAATIDAELVKVDVEGYRAMLLADDSEAATSADGSVVLLPHFDSYVIGFHPRNQLLPPDWATRVPPRTVPAQLQTLLIDGKVAGLWERQIKGGKLEIRVDPFIDLSRKQQELLEAEAERVGQILQATPNLSIAPVGVHPHL